MFTIGKCWPLELALWEHAEEYCLDFLYDSELSPIREGTLLKTLVPYPLVPVAGDVLTVGATLLAIIADQGS
jgi:hypothetical protein